MSTPMGKQSIHCSVKSCTYHSQKQDACELNGIQVAAKVNGSGGTPQDESLCASYRCHK